MTLHNFKFNVIALLEALITFRGNCAVMHKNIGAIVAPDEPITFRVIEPLDRTFHTFHVRPLGPSSFGPSPYPAIDAIVLPQGRAVKGLRHREATNDAALTVGGSG